MTTISLGRTVWYQPRDAGARPRMALVADVHDPATGDVTLAVVTSNGFALEGTRACYAESLTPGCWSWPPRVSS